MRSFLADPYHIRRAWVVVWSIEWVVWLGWMGAAFVFGYMTRLGYGWSIVAGYGCLLLVAGIVDTVICTA
jgi:hypothetical protein